MCICHGRAGGTCRGADCGADTGDTGAAGAGRSVSDRHVAAAAAAIAEVRGVLEAASGEVSLVTAGPLGVVALLNAAEGGTAVFEFVVDVERDFAQSDDQTQNCDRGDQDQFGGNDETGFVVLQGGDELEHLRVSFLVGSGVR